MADDAGAPNFELRTPNLFRDSALTVATSAAVVLLSIYITGALARSLAPEEFSYYQLARRLIGFLFPVASLALGAGLTQALLRLKDDQPRALAAARGAALVLAAVNAALLAFAALAPASARRLLLAGAGDEAGIWMLVFLWLAAYSGYILLYAYHRGRLDMRAANLVSLLTNGIVPAALLTLWAAFGHLDAVTALALTAVPCLGCCLWYLWTTGDCWSRARENWTAARQNLLPFSLPRVPAGCLAAAAAWLIPWFLEMDNKTVAALAFLSGILVLQAVHSFTDSLGQVLFPMSTLWQSQGDRGALSALASKTLGFSLHCGAVGSVQLILWADVVTRAWFGEGYAEAGAAVRGFAFCLIPAMLHNPTRAILDGVEPKALTTTALAAGVAAAGAVCAAFWAAGALGLGAACAAMFASLAVTTGVNLFHLGHRVEITLEPQRLLEALVLASALGGVSLLLRLLAQGLPFVATLFLAALAGLLCLAATAAWAAVARPAWFPRA